MSLDNAQKPQVTSNNDDIVKQIEEQYPEITKEYKRIMREQYDMFCKKMNNYGKGNIMLGGDVNSEEDRRLSLSGITIRLNDKTNRLINLLFKNKKNTVNESAIDSFQDIVNYSIIAQIVNNIKWK